MSTVLLEVAPHPNTERLVRALAEDVVLHRSPPPSLDTPLWTSATQVFLVHAATVDAAIAWAKTLGDEKDSQRPTVVLLCAPCDEATLARAYEAGIKDHAFRPFDAPELATRIRTARLRRQLAPPPRDPRLGIVSKLASWQTLARTVRDALGELLGRTIEAAPPKRAEQLVTIGTTITLVDVGKQIEVVLGIGASAAALSAIGRCMLGEAPDDPAMAADLTKELANCVIGKVKSALVKDGLTPTMGLPTPCSPRDFRDVWLTLGEHVDASAVVDGSPLWIRCGLRWRGTTEIEARNLAEPMVLADDLTNERGILLLPRGTRVTTTMAERLARHVPLRRVRICSV